MGSVGQESGQTWLQKLEEQLNVDVDWMDPTYSKNLQITPNDQTSNNLWVNQQMDHPENKEMFQQVCKELKGDWKAAYTRIVGRQSLGAIAMSGGKAERGSASGSWRILSLVMPRLRFCWRREALC